MVLCLNHTDFSNHNTVYSVNEISGAKHNIEPITQNSEPSNPRKNNRKHNGEGDIHNDQNVLCCGKEDFFIFSPSKTSFHTNTLL